MPHGVYCGLLRVTFTLDVVTAVARMEQLVQGLLQATCPNRENTCFGVGSAGVSG